MARVSSESILLALALAVRRERKSPFVVGREPAQGADAGEQRLVAAVERVEEQPALRHDRPEGLAHRSRTGQVAGGERLERGPPGGRQDVLAVVLGVPVRHVLLVHQVLGGVVGGEGLTEAPDQHRTGELQQRRQGVGIDHDDPVQRGAVVLLEQRAGDGGVGGQIRGHRQVLEVVRRVVAAIALHELGLAAHGQLEPLRPREQVRDPIPDGERDLPLVCAEDAERSGEAAQEPTLRRVGEQDQVVAIAVRAEQARARPPGPRWPVGPAVARRRPGG